MNLKSWGVKWSWLGWLRAVAQVYNYSEIKIELEQFSKEFKELGNNIELGLGWLRAVAQKYSCNYNCNERNIELLTNFQTNLKNEMVKLNWGLVGCARWRKVTGTVTIKVKLNWGVYSK